MNKTLIEYDAAAAAPATKKPKTGPIRITGAQAELFMPEIRQKQCYLVVPAQKGKEYWKAPGAGYSPTPEHRYTVGEALETAKTPGNFIELVDQELAAEIIASKRKNNILAILKPNVLELFKAAPDNPTVRGVVMSKCGKLIPESVKGYHDGKQWLEENWEPRNALEAVAKQEGNTAFTIDLRFTDIETGRATYRVARYATESLDLPAEWIREAMAAVGEGARGIEPVLNQLLRIIQRRARDICEPEMDYDNWQYSDEEVHDTEGHAVSPDGGTEALRAMLQDYFAATLTAEQRRNLGL